MNLGLAAVFVVGLLGGVMAPLSGFSGLAPALCAGCNAQVEVAGEPPRTRAVADVADDALVLSVRTILRADADLTPAPLAWGGVDEGGQAPAHDLSASGDATRGGSACGDLREGLSGRRALGRG